MESRTSLTELVAEQKPKKQELDLAPDDISCTNNEKHYKTGRELYKTPAAPDHYSSRIQLLKTSLPAFLILLPLLFGLTFDNKTISTKALGKDVLHRRLTEQALCLLSLGLQTPSA